MSPRLTASDLFLKAQTDERLAALAGAGHGRAFAILVDRHRRALLAHAQRLVGQDRGEDVYQQALLRSWRALEAGSQLRNPAAWLHRILHNAALSELERQVEIAEPLDERVADPQTVVAAAEQRHELRQVLHGLADLPERQRLALLGTELEGRSRRQLAEELGVSEGAVRQLVHRARAGVRTAVAAVFPFPLLMRMMRMSGWLPAARTATPPSAPVASASGILAGGLLKAGAVVVALGGAVGGGIILHDREQQRPRSAAFSLHPGHAHGRTEGGSSASSAEEPAEQTATGAVARRGLEIGLASETGSSAARQSSRGTGSTNRTEGGAASPSASRPVRSGGDGGESSGSGGSNSTVGEDAAAPAPQREEPAGGGGDPSSDGSSSTLSWDGSGGSTDSSGSGSDSSTSGSDTGATTSTSGDTQTSGADGTSSGADSTTTTSSAAPEGSGGSD